MDRPHLRINLQLFAGERTEPATPRRRQEARRKGQVAKTAELAPALILMILFFLLVSGAGRIGKEVYAFTVRTFEEGLVSSAILDPGNVPSLLTDMALFATRLTAPFIAVALFIGLFSQVVQIGFLSSTTPLQPQFQRINPIAGFKRIFSKRALVELLKSTMKIALVGTITYFAVRQSIPTVLSFSQMPLMDAVALTGQILLRAALWVSVALLIIALADYMYQRWEFEQSLRMSKQEVREELRQTEGDPQIRAKIRQRQRQIAGMRMMAQVPTADVVITNPVHLAVALRYDEETMEAPVVVAKGAGPLAKRIQETAREHQIAVVENVWLARSLYESVEVNASVPEELYQAVAEVLAFVYRLRGNPARQGG